MASWLWAMAMLSSVFLCRLHCIMPGGGVCCNAAQTRSEHLPRSSCASSKHLVPPLLCGVCIPNTSLLVLRARKFEKASLGPLSTP